MDVAAACFPFCMVNWSYVGLALKKRPSCAKCARSPWRDASSLLREALREVEALAVELEDDDEAETVTAAQ